MNETAAREVVAIRALEAADDTRAIWSDADRDWATRAAAEVVGPDAPADAFLARRAALALERLGGRQPAFRRRVGRTFWRAWLAPVIVVVAFALGVAADQLGGKRINILAPPLVALLAWNLVVYVVIAIGPLLRAVAGRPVGALGPFRSFFARLFRSVPQAGPASAGGSVEGAAAHAFALEWARLSAPLTGARVARILHLAAAAFAAGAVLGMYLRGLVFEYRAGWESTFLGAETVRRFLAFVLSPGVLVTGLGVPDASQLEAIRFTGTAGGENAARWIHLYAATIGLVVVLPRLLLAGVARLRERTLTTRFPVPVDEPYYRRLSRDYAQGPARTVVVPYSYQPPSASVDGLTKVLARTFGPRTRVEIQEPIAYGEEESAATRLASGSAADVLVALFNLAATPEAENHVALLAALSASQARKAAVIALVDESAYARRFADQPARVDERRAAWRAALQSARVDPVFLDLGGPDLAAAEAALRARVERGYSSGGGQ